MAEVDAGAAARIVVNGEPVALPSQATVAALIEQRRPRPPFAVEVNRSLVRRDAYEATALRAGDVVEIVTLVGGGDGAGRDTGASGKRQAAKPG